MASGTEVDGAAVSRLRASLRGSLLLPADEDYDQARQVWNAMIDRRPALIVRPADEDDVVRAVDFARSRGLLLAVRGGGHSFAGKSVCDGGMMLDLSTMKRVEVDLGRHTVRADGGVTLGELDETTQAHGLATPMGTAPPTGIAGLTLGGGLGWIMGQHALACDNLLAARVVTADGRVVTAHAEEHGDLLWGLRGGGGNFGVVTSFEFRLHRVGPVLGGAVQYDFSQAKDVLRFYREYTDAAPDALTAFAGILPVGGLPSFCIAVCWCGDLAAGERALAPLRRFGSPVADTIRVMPYVEMQALLTPPPLRAASYARSGFLLELDDRAMEAMNEGAARGTAPLSSFFIEHLHGAACRIGPEDTAFRHRQPGYNFVTLAAWVDASDTDASIGWVRGVWDTMQPFVGREAYTNYLAEEGRERVREAYGPNYERLVALKRTYDPTNFFRLNQNVDPEG